MDDKDTVDTDLTNQDDTQSGQVDDAESSSDAPSDEQPTEDTEELLAGKYRDPKELEKAYKELESKLGSYKTVEEKARAFDRLARQRSTPTPVARPQLGQFITDDGTIDVKSYDNAMAQYEARKDQYLSYASNKTAQESADAIRAEKDYPFIVSDQRAQKLAYSLYASGEVGSLYEAVREVAEMRNETSTNAKQAGAKEKEREIAKKVRSKTEGGTAKGTGGAMTQEAFNRMSSEEKRAFINKMAAENE